MAHFLSAGGAVCGNLIECFDRLRNSRSDEESLMEHENQPARPAAQSNLRRHLRAPLIVEKLACGDGRKTFFGYARNISCGGLFIATVNPREPGDQFTLQLTLPTPAQHTLQCRCEVVWKRHFAQGNRHEPGMGLRFLDLPAASAEELERWLHSVASAAPH
jgi:uncharacterized protein (TIGR02266 family)